MLREKDTLFTALRRKAAWPGSTVMAVFGDGLRCGIRVALGVLAALLLCVPSAWATAPTPVTCGELPTLLGSGPGQATSSEVLQLPVGTCPTNLTVTNTAAFTLEGATGGGTTLKPSNTAEPIIQSSENVTFTLTGLTFTGTEASAVALTAGNEAVTLSGNAFLATKTKGEGGAIYIQQTGSSSEPTVITGNNFSDDGAALGGAVYLLGDIAAVIDGNTFSADDASAGGGLYVLNFQSTSNPVQISGNVFGGTNIATGNTAQSQGGGAALALGPGQPLTINENAFTNNRITGSGTATAGREGAGLFVGVSSASAPFPVWQSHNVFSGNVIDETAKPGVENLPAGGGAEWITGLPVQSVGDSFTYNRITIDDGAAPEGGAVGAIAAANEAPAPAEPASFIGSDDLFLDNAVDAGGWGGAIYVGGPSASCTGSCPGSSVTLNDSTITGNDVEAGAGSEGGAIWGSPNDVLSVNNSIVFGDQPEPEIYGFNATTPTFAYSDVCTEPGGPTVQPGTGNICANPQLESDGEESASSPTIDAGSNALVPTGLESDLVGAPRIVASRGACYTAPSAIVDMGAFEYQHPGPAPSCPAMIPMESVHGNGQETGPPLLSDISESNHRWREGTRLASFSRKRKSSPVGTTFSLTLNEQAEVRFTFKRLLRGRRVGGLCFPQTKKNERRHTCKRNVIQGLMSFAAHAGTNRVSFQGRIASSTKLSPGSYTLVIAATDSAGRRSASKRLRFTILK